MYQYNATVVRVVDGDTVYLNVDLGFNLTIQVDVRMGGINAPELNTSPGVAAKNALSAMIPVGTKVLLDSKGKDKYGRWVGVISVDGQTTSINQQMLAGGFAVPYMQQKVVGVV